MMPSADPLPGAMFKVPTFPSLAIDNLPGGNGARYVVWNDRRDGNNNVYFSRSTGSSTTFSTPKRITNTVEDEFFPTIVVGANHFLSVLFYRRTPSATDQFDVYATISLDGGETFQDPPARLNECGPITPGGFSTFIGDYIGFDGINNHHAVWMDSRLGEQDIFTTLIGGC